MIEAVIYCGAGFLFAALIGIALAPVIHSRAVRLTMRRLENSVPQSLAEIQADKDLLRAEFALSMHRLERGAEKLQEQNTSQLAELGRKSDAINRLKIERETQKVEAVALQTELDTLRDRFRATSKEIKAAGDQDHSDDLVSLVPKEWPAAEEPRVAREGSDFSAESQVTIPATPVSAHKFGNQFVRKEPSIGGRISRSLAYYSIAALIGAGAAFAWQLYGDDAKEMVGVRIPSLGQLLSVSTTKRPFDVATKPADTAAPQDDSAALSQQELAQQLENDLERVVASAQHGDEEQVAAKQKQGVQDIATPQVKQDTKQAMPSPSTQDQSMPAGLETTSTTIAGWTLREVTNGTAVLQGPIGILKVTCGETVPGLGKVTSIVRWGNGWVVATSSGYCTSASPNHLDGICKPYRGN
jgi:hypothetical protein